MYDKLSVSIVDIRRGHLMLGVKTKLFYNLGPLVERELQKSKCLAKKFPYNLNDILHTLDFIYDDLLSMAAKLANIFLSPKHANGIIANGNR